MSGVCLLILFLYYYCRSIVSLLCYLYYDIDYLDYYSILCMLYLLLLLLLLLLPVTPLLLPLLLFYRLTEHGTQRLVEFIENHKHTLIAAPTTTNTATITSSTSTAKPRDFLYKY